MAGRTAQTVTVRSRRLHDTCRCVRDFAVHGDRYDRTVAARDLLYGSRMSTRSLSALVIASSLVACASDGGEAFELPETISDGAADSWGHPTKFGTLFQGVWQFGEIDPSRSMSYPAWSFALGGDAEVAIESRQAPTDEPELERTAMYLYQQRDDGTWRRIARSDAAGFGALTKSLGAGMYRVIVKGIATDDTGQFLLRLDCTGDGCAQGAQCLFGDTFWEIRDIHEGALIDYGKRVLTADSELPAPLQAQIIAAVRESSHDDVTTVAEAFERVDQNEINRFRFWDNLAGRSIIALEYGAGDNSYGALFVEDTATVAAGIHDGDIANCQVTPRACVFGQSMGDAAFMPDMTSQGRRALKSPAGVDAMLAEQIITAVSYDTRLTLAEAFENVDDGTIYVQTLRHRDGREFVEVQWYGGDNPVGAFFRAGTTEIVATNGDGEIAGCTAF